MPDAAAEAVEQQQYLTFFLAGEEYALGILRVKEIIEYDRATTVPRAPKWIRGVINLRGTVVPVVDLAVKFGLAESAVTKTTCIIIVEALRDTRTTIIGVIADAVSQVMDVLAEDIRPVPEFGAGIQAGYLLGVTQLGKRFALLLDMDSVLSKDELRDDELPSLAQDAHAREGASHVSFATQTLESGERALQKAAAPGYDREKKDTARR